jgi:glutaminyl-peptide cyclotransferase
VLLIGFGLLLVGAAAVWRLWPRPAWMQGFRVVHAYPHDPTAYCQGLVFDGGLLHESTGRYGESTLRTVELETGKVLRRQELPEGLFGEGLALVGEKLIQLTWKEGVARVSERSTLNPLDQFEYEGEGWGLAFDGRHLIQSDGTDRLVFRDPATFAEVRRVRVQARGKPLLRINELEWVEGELYANMWKSDLIARIDPASGEVLGFIDLTGIFDHRSIPDPDGVLNGIAYDPQGQRLFVTGKLWPKLFEIELVRQ